LWNELIFGRAGDQTGGTQYSSTRER
jgi:hypothetical protein